MSIKLSADERDLAILGKYFKNPHVWNTTDKIILYQVSDDLRGVSHTVLETLRKHGLKLFSMYLINPKNTGNGIFESRCNLMFQRNLKN